jgi:hypothetical protein
LKKRKSLRVDDADKKLDSLERMTWIEQGGIDLRAAKEPGAKASRPAKPPTASNAVHKPKIKPKIKLRPKPKAKATAKPKAKPKAKSRPKPKVKGTAKSRAKPRSGPRTKAKRNRKSTRRGR